MAHLPDFELLLGCMAAWPCKMNILRECPLSRACIRRRASFGSTSLSNQQAGMVEGVG